MPDLSSSQASGRAYVRTAFIALVVAVASALGISFLHSRSDHAGQVQLTLQQLETDASGAAAALLAGSRYPVISDFLDVERQRNREAIATHLETLDRLVDPVDARQVRDRMNTFLAVSRRSEDALAATRGLIAWQRLTSSIAELQREAASTTASARRQASIGIWTILLLGAAIVSLLVTRFRRAQRRSEVLEDEVSRDALTRLVNHGAFHARLVALMEQASRNDTPLALILGDLDHFKQINDSHGHQVGDRVLLETAERLQRVSRSGDVVARIGGEEFAWILPGANPAVACESAERLRLAIASEALDGDVAMTISVGVAMLGPAMSPDALFHEADTALYAAKDAGRNRVCLAGALQPV